jgi:hypothetical protein
VRRRFKRPMTSEDELGDSSMNFSSLVPSLFSVEKLSVRFPPFHGTPTVSIELARAPFRQYRP